MERFGSLVRAREDEPGPSGEKHAPAIEAPDRVSPGERFRVRVVVGREVPHPNTVEHHIKWIRVFARGDGLRSTPPRWTWGPRWGSRTSRSR